MLRISAHSSQEIQAVILATKAVDRELRKQIRQHTRQMVLPEWQKAVAEHAHTRLEQRVLGATARALVSDQNVTLKAAHIGRSLSGGAKPPSIARGVEFGSGSGHKQFKSRNNRGYVFFPAAAGIIPRIAALWAQTAARTLHEAFEKAG